MERYDITNTGDLAQSGQQPPEINARPPPPPKKKEIKGDVCILAVQIIIGWRNMTTV